MMVKSKPTRRRLNIGHKHGGKVVDIVAIGHDSYKGRAGWFFRGVVEWGDGSHKRDPHMVSTIYPFMLCFPEDGDRTDLDKAMAAMSQYLSEVGTYKVRPSLWVPREPEGERAVTL